MSKDPGEIGTHRDRLPLGRKLCYAVTVFVLLALLGEGAVRVREKILYGTFSRAGSDLYVAGPRGALLKPGVDVQGSRMQIHTNALGFRGPEVAVPKPQGTVRVLCLGGSTTYDIYAKSDATTWPARLQSKLQEKHPRVEVVNGGLSGGRLDVDLSPERWSNVEKAQPDLIVVYHATNEISIQAQDDYRRKHATPVETTATKVLKLVTDESLLAYKVVLLFETLTKPREVEGQDELSPDGSASFEANLRELVRRAKSMGARVALATFALRWRRDRPLDEQRSLAEGAFQYYPGLSLAGIDKAFASYEEVVRRVAKDEGCLVIPVDDRMSGVPARFEDVMHFSSEGSEEMASVVASALEGSKLLDLTMKR